MNQDDFSLNLVNTAEVLRRAPVLMVSLIFGKNEPNKGYSSISLIKMS